MMEQSLPAFAMVYHHRFGDAGNSMNTRDKAIEGIELH
jgi:hypothetical protein